MLLLKLFLVPFFLLVLSLASKLWGPSVAGWLAGLPVVAGPILFFLAVERGESFASSAAAASLSAVLASVTFSLAYSRAAVRFSWQRSMIFAISAWGVVAYGLAMLRPGGLVSLVMSLLALVLAPRLFLPALAQPPVRAISKVELVYRMCAGAVLTLLVTLSASVLGQGWSGLLAVFPVLGIVLAVFSHRSQGAVFAATLLRSMIGGLYSFIGFCYLLSIALPSLGIPMSFVAAVSLALLIQAITFRRPKVSLATP